MATNDTNKSQAQFPSHADPTKQKDSNKWGLQVANAIEWQWFTKDSTLSQFYVNRNRYHTYRLYAKGDQSTQKYRDEFTINGDFSFLNLDYTPVPIVPKFVDIVVNGMQDRSFEVKAQAVDPVASANRKDFIENMRSEMENKESLMLLQEQSGVPVFDNDPDTLPSSEEELEIHMQKDYKQGIETAMESAINYELTINEYDNTKYRVDYDLTTIGIGAVKHQFIPGEGIKVEYVDPSDLVYSHTDSKYYDDCYYFGEVKRIHITDLQVQFPHLNAEEVMKIERSGYGSLEDYYSPRQNRDDYESGFVDVLFFCYKTVHNEIYKAKDTVMGTPKVIEKDENFTEPKKGAGYKKISRSNEVVYEGVKILGKEILLKWELQKNMVRPSLHSPKVIMPYIVASPKQYKGKVYSLVKRMEKYADAIQLINLKIQQVIQRMTPSGVFLDIDGLAEVDLGNGTTYNPQTALDMYFQTGSVIGRSLTNENEFNHGRVPIQELPGGAGNQLQPLLAVYEYNLQQIRNVTGLNEARDGSTPDPDALVGVQKLAAANSNTATRHILQSSEYIKRRLCEGLSLRINDVLEYAPNKNDYINAIGKYNVEILDDLGDLSAHEFGIFIQLGPDEEEKARLDAHIQASIARGELKIEDAIAVMEIPNIRLANQVLKLKRKQRTELEHQMQQENIDRQNQGLIQVAQEKANAEAQASMMKAEAEIKVEEAKANYAMQKLERETQLEIEILNIKAQLEAEARGVQMTHEDIQNTKKIDSQKKGIKGDKGPGGVGSDISIGNKANTVDGKTRTGGLL